MIKDALLGIIGAIVVIISLPLLATIYWGGEEQRSTCICLTLQKPNPV